MRPTNMPIFSMNRTANKGSKGRSRRWLGYLLLILAIFAGLHWWQTRSLAGGDAPALAGELAGGGRFDLGKPRDRPDPGPFLGHLVSHVPAGR